MGLEVVEARGTTGVWGSLDTHAQCIPSEIAEISEVVYDRYAFPTEEGRETVRKSWGADWLAA